MNILASQMSTVSPFPKPLVQAVFIASNPDVMGYVAERDNALLAGISFDEVLLGRWNPATSRGRKMSLPIVIWFFQRKVRIVVLTIATYAALC